MNLYQKTVKLVQNLEKRKLWCFFFCVCVSILVQYIMCIHVTKGNLQEIDIKVQVLGLSLNALKFCV